MKRKIIRIKELHLLFFLIVVLSCGQNQSDNKKNAKTTGITIMPRPQYMEFRENWLPLGNGFRIAWAGFRNSILDSATARFQNYVARRISQKEGDTSGLRLVINCSRDDTNYLTIGAREHYSITVKSGIMSLTTDGPTGVLRGLATIRQLITDRQEGFAIPVIMIDDTARFKWRGLMIDVARHFYSIATIKRQIDLMELVKLNVLHLHLSDNEGFRVESLVYPKLQKGSTEFYSQGQIRELISYAADRGVRIVPEFDVPGHSLAILKAYPEYASSKVDGRDYISAMGAALNPANPETFHFLDRLFGEMASLFSDQYFHIGGAEVSGADWKANQQVQGFMKTNGLKDVGQLESYFFFRARKSVLAQGKKVIGWEEIARTSLPNDILVQTWRSSSAVARVTKDENKIISSCGFFLDKLLPAEDYYKVDPQDPTGCGMTKEQFEEAKAKGLPEAILDEDQVIDPSLKLSEQQKSLVLGGEAALWTEIVTEEMVDGRVWPGAAVIAERLWSPSSVTDIPDMHRRLINIVEGLRVGGLMDSINRKRMAERLAPGDSKPVELLLDLVSPVRNHAHNRMGMAVLKGKEPTPQNFDELADAASPESPVALRFELDAEQFAQGDHSNITALRSTLTSWHNNHDLFAKVAQGNPKLEVALPISSDIAALSQTGLEAIKAIEGKQRPDADWRDRAKKLLDRQDAAEKASASIVEVATMEQPPAHLLMRITTGIRKLVEAAEKI